ncbi:MAG: SDR family NAD(P)-dependent oxidoreductase, partial [Moorea sp. SIO2I5]|nr:SDR family NAD(P)-dependent oxidoreductase [Moorena sp. SIO2I5]
LDDLNLDSIKAGELVAMAAKELGVSGEIDPSSLANSTLKEVADVLQKALPQAEEKSSSVPSQTTEAGSVDLPQLLLKQVEERTGFPSSTLSMELRLLDDLNLDSIKAGELVASFAKQVGVSGELDPSTLANATLQEVVEAMGSAKPVEVKPKKTVKPETILDTSPSWVRNFAVEYVAQDKPTCSVENWSTAKVLIVADTINHPLVTVLAEKLLALKAQIQKATYQNFMVDEDSSKINYSHYIAILPQNSEIEPSEFPLVEMTARLKSIATPGNNKCITYVQFGGGQFGNQGIHPECCCAAGFARSVHLEQPDLRVRVVDVAKTLNPQQIADCVIEEIAGDAAIVTAGYNQDLIRFVPQSSLQQPVQYQPRSIHWSNDDVILVTGGAKGITAECALAVAELTGVKMALVGRSPLPTNGEGEIAQTLARFQTAGLTCRYYSCDIAQAQAVTQLVERVTTELGTITGVIHGAGLNKPRRVEQVSLEAAQTEVSPKLLGAYHLLQALEQTPPKLFLAFSSIIGVTGMPGNAWYAFANESLSILLRQFQDQHRDTQVLSLAYSVWDEVGMGARMGSVKNLERMGIHAISKQEGVSRFLKLFECDPGVDQVVIAARLGGLDTWSPVPVQSANQLRFIERVVTLEPHVELKVRTHLTLKCDRYVEDHIWRGSYLFPTVFGLEAMAEAVAYVTAEAQPSIVRIENISLRRPVVVNDTTGVEIEIHAEVMETDSNGERQVKLGIRTEQTGFNTDHFSATFVLADKPVGETLPAETFQHQGLTIEPKQDLYGDLLFQGPRFQQMGEIFSLNSQQGVFCSQVRPLDELVSDSFNHPQGQTILLGDPYFRDVLLQSVQLTIPRHICLPVEISKIEFFQNSNPDETARRVQVILQQREDQEYISQVVATNEAGVILERLSGYRLRILEEHPENPTAEQLANPQAADQETFNGILQQTAGQLDVTLPGMSLGYAPNLQTQSKPQRRKHEKPIIADAIQSQLGLSEAAEVKFRIKTLDSGKPQLTGKLTTGLDLSLSHCDRYCLAVVGETPQGCDIEAIDHRTTEDWVALLTPSRQAMIEELVQQGDTYDQAGTRIWSALEAIRKAFNGTNPEFSIVAKQGDGVLLQTETPNGTYLVLTIPVKLTRPPQRMVAVLVNRQPSLPSSSIIHPQEAVEVDQSHPDHSRSHRTRYTQDGPQGQLVYEQRYQVSFKDSGSISRRVYFAQYFRWVGKIRELPMESIASEMLGDFLTGDWGMVTNAVSLRVLGEATSYDIVQARAWVGNVVGSSFDTYIEFCKVLPDDSLERIAIAEVKATWVRLVSYGVPSPMPFPEYLQTYLERFAAQTPATLDLKRPETLPLPPLPASLAQLDTGATVYQTSMEQSRYGKLLYSQVFQTTLEESNLVGNVYYGNYFIWQGRTLDLFLYSVAPEYLRVSNPCGEMVCLYTRMDYLREAMPFDQIRTVLYVQSVSECGAVFNFEFFREQPDGTSEKLHVGQQEVAWIIRKEDGTAVATPWPSKVMQVLTGMFSPESVSVVANSFVH